MLTVTYAQVNQVYDRQIIRYTKLENKPKLVEVKDAYGIRTDRPHVWLQKVCCWVLSKLGATHTYKTDVFTVHDVDVTDLFDSFKQQYNDILRTTDKMPSRVLIGVDDFHKLTGAPITRQMLNFNITACGSRYHYADIVNIPVWVLPWMSGILVLP